MGSFNSEKTRGRGGPNKTVRDGGRGGIIILYGLDREGNEEVKKQISVPRSVPQ